MPRPLARRLGDAREMVTTTPETGYAPVNGLEMYYEMRGAPTDREPPLVLLHGAFSNIETDFGRVLPGLGEARRVIGVEQQAHGRTADVDRPLRYEQMANDTAALLRHHGVARADFFCYSFGGGVALQLSVRHPELVRKLVLTGGTGYDPAGYYGAEESVGGGLTPEQLTAALAGTPWQEAYARIAPNPDDWGTLVAKELDLDRSWRGWAPETIRAVKAPALLVIGGADIVRPEHTVEMFRLLGGGVPGDMVGVPASWLAVLPGTTHVTLVERADWLVSMTEAFLAAPMPKAGAAGASGGGA
jgi:pimeloyl-ACP methyl ester carboxylesterase